MASGNLDQSRLLVVFPCPYDPNFGISFLVSLDLFSVWPLTTISRNNIVSFFPPPPSLPKWDGSELFSLISGVLWYWAVSAIWLLARTLVWSNSIYHCHWTGGPQTCQECTDLAHFAQCLCVELYWDKREDGTKSSALLYEANPNLYQQSPRPGLDYILCGFKGPWCKLCLEYLPIDCVLVVSLF